MNNLISNEDNRLKIDIDKLRDASEDLAKYVLKHPVEAVSMFESQLDQKIKDINDDSGKNPNPDKVM